MESRRYRLVDGRQITKKEEEEMRLFWKYFFQGFGHYFIPSHSSRDITNDKFQFDFSNVTSDFTKVYNKMKETIK